MDHYRIVVLTCSVNPAALSNGFLIISAQSARKKIDFLVNFNRFQLIP